MRHGAWDGDFLQNLSGNEVENEIKFVHLQHITNRHLI
ncbi:hypothetical protein HMPREF9303_2289 [Prevotella denticola CRIS 18C-A]|uniref:Uncharacterized protein n=1 Tax=Prevotella denticola CRIS 18C-A TaxID=944557 RepID=F0H3V3_9BACT|nr:hypothetical protein HMPREF9303_2289 [Prevotella denticola CRIS 18C-A]